MSISSQEMDCPFCKNAKISVTITPECYSHKTARAAHQVKSIPIYHPEKIKVNSKCPNCKKSAKEIERALETGITREISHEERLKRLKEAGLPTKIETRHR